jgi:hypothetical protein
MEIYPKSFEFPRGKCLGDPLAEKLIDHAGKRCPPGTLGHCYLVWKQRPCAAAGQHP